MRIGDLKEFVSYEKIVGRCNPGTDCKPNRPSTCKCGANIKNCDSPEDYNCVPSQCEQNDKI